VAFLVSIGLFAYFWIVGFAVLGALYRRNDLVRSTLIAPAVGIVTVLYANYLLSRAGFAIGTVAKPLAVILAVMAIAALIWQRPKLPGWPGLPYLPLLVLAFVASGWPLFENGFAWLSNFNPDAANYMLDTNRLIRLPFAEITDAATWRNQTDWASYYVIYPLLGIRTGTDLLFAWAVTVVGRDETAIYMPLIVSWHVAALAAAATLVGTAHRFARLLGAFLLTVSALSSLGVTSQLLGQELGLTCLSLASVLLLSPFYRLARPALARFVVLTGFVMAGFLLSYPEMLPFLGLGFLIYHGVQLRELRRYWRSALAGAFAIGGLAAAATAPDIWALVKFLFDQAAASNSKMLYPELFPYFLIPSGLSALWGLSPFSSSGGALFGPDTAIMIGLGLTGAALPATIWLVLQRQACAALLAVMAVLAVALAEREAGFGIFKLAMYAQPFLMTTMALAACRLLRVAR
jgi:hypothetical protein